MKHAIIILAHKDLENLPHLIEYFQHDCYIYIHIDKGAKISKELLDTIKSEPNVVFVSRKYRVHWGGMSMLKCEMYLLKEVYKRDDVDYIHLHSGQDYPIKPFEYWYHFFENSNDISYIACQMFPSMRGSEQTYKRYQYYYPYDFQKQNQRMSSWLQKFIKWQQNVGIKRRIPDQFKYLYCGSQWFSITRESFIKLIEYHKKHKAFYRRMEFTFAPEETYIQTILENLQFDKIMPINYRYIRWRFENNNKPSNLGIEHFHLLAESESLFARKMAIPYCDSLIKALDTYLLVDSPVISMPNGGWEYNGFLKYKYNEQISIAIHKYCQWQNLHTVLDAGCGAGFMVAALRRRKIRAVGFDTNKYTPKLSSLLLAVNDKPCECFDLTQPFNIIETYELVTCLNVLEYIPGNLLDQALNNLITFASKCIIISIDCKHTKYDNVVQQLKHIIINNNYIFNQAMSMYMTFTAPMYGKIFVFENKNYLSQTFKTY
ncbi:MAG: methyltransferase domain-containing protein [Bacteroidaceae bacterium]|nr:methyltransferase domain-containing protein [Bacteroidaceae bacterium]